MSMFRTPDDMVRITKPTIKTVSTYRFKCTYCNTNEWLTETDLAMHKQEVHLKDVAKDRNEHKDSYCMICMKVQQNRDCLIKHIKTHHLYTSEDSTRLEREIFICDHCNRIFFNKEILTLHILYAHLYKKPAERYNSIYSCPVCRKNRRLTNIWFHFKLHDVPSLELCDICLKCFPSVNDMIAHTKSHPAYYRCEICSFQCQKDVHYKDHLAMHVTKPFKNKNVTNLESYFRGPCLMTVKVKFNVHNTLKGLDVPKFINICVLCREICEDAEKMRLHIVRDHMRDVEEKRGALCACGAEFYTKILLKQHVFKLKQYHRALGAGEQPLSQSELLELEGAHLGNKDRPKGEHELDVMSNPSRITKQVFIATERNFNSDTAPQDQPSFATVIKLAPKTTEEENLCEITQVSAETQDPLSVMDVETEKSEQGI